MVPRRILLWLKPRNYAEATFRRLCSLWQHFSDQAKGQTFTKDSETFQTPFEEVCGVTRVYFSLGIVLMLMLVVA